MSKTKTTVVSFDEFSCLDYVHPTKFFIKDASGDYVFIHKQKRNKAQEYVDEMYGSGKYTVRTSSL